MAVSKPDTSSSPHPPSHCADYHLICCIEDIPAHRFGKPDVTAPAAFFTSCVLVSLIGGFGLKLAVTFRRFRDSLTLKPSQHEDLRAVGINGGKVVLENPVRFATRALTWGTACAIIGSGAVGLTAVYIWKL